MIDVETYGAAVGAAKRYTDEHSGSDDAVKYTEQDLTAAQQAQARENIGAGTSSFSGSYGDLTNTPPLVKGGGYGGNTIGGTGVNTNTTRYANSVAYGNSAVATADYAFAFGDNATAGNYNRSTGKHAVAIGKDVKANKDYEFAYGKFNQSNDDTAFSIGDGTGENDRHNLMELKTDGTLMLNGDAVKTESNIQYPRLGQIFGTFPNSGSTASTKPISFARGIAYCFSATTGVTKVTFPTGKSNTASDSYYRAFVFGDFLASRTASDSTSVIFFLHRTFDSFSRILVESCEGMFNNCKALTTIDNISLFDTSEVHFMNFMFYQCEALTALDLSNFDTSKVQNMVSMFYGCTALRNLDLSSFDLTNVTSYGSMFYNAGITTLKTPKINPHDDIPLPRTLYSQDGTAYTTLPVTTGTSIELRTSWT